MRSTATGLVVGALLAGCAAPIPQRPPPPPFDNVLEPLVVQVDEAELAANPGLVERVTESPYNFFRFANLPFERKVCELFADAVPQMPPVNLHGDAHLEQYAIRKDGRGLADYDDATSGPAVVDLIRFLVSLRLALRERGWEAHRDGLIDVFLESYVRGLEDETLEAPEPRWATETMNSFTVDRRAFLQEVDGMMRKLSASEQTYAENAYGRYRALMLAQSPELGAPFFEVKALGGLKTGIGSALDKKFLVRIEGPTAELDDDEVLEMKEVRDLSGVSCVQATSAGSAFRILVSLARISRSAQPLLAEIPRGEGEPLDAPAFWVQAWDHNYREIDISEEPATHAELEEIVRDIGIQLGVGHTAEIADPLRFQLRQRLHAIVDEFRVQIVVAADEIEVMAVKGWEAFKKRGK